MKNTLTCLTLLCLILLTACHSTSPIKNYLLMPDETLSPRQTSVSIHLGSISVPAFLNRKDLVRLINNEQIVNVPNCQWASSLDKAIHDTLEQNLAILLGQDAIVSHKSAKTITINLTFRHFEITDENFLRVRLLLSQTDRSTIPVSFDIPLSDYPSIAAAHNAALSRIAQTIADSL